MPDFNLLYELNKYYAKSNETELLEYIANYRIVNEIELNDSSNRIDYLKHLILDHISRDSFIECSTDMFRLTCKLQENFKFEHNYQAYIMALLLRKKFPKIKDDRLVNIPKPIFYNTHILMNIIEYYINSEK